jgi:hypothetical protein
MVRFRCGLVVALACLALLGCRDDDAGAGAPGATDSGAEGGKGGADSAAADAPSGDAGPDASDPDGSEPDASEPDASEPDASEPDASEPDAARPDGSTGCATSAPTLDGSLTLRNEDDVRRARCYVEITGDVTVDASGLSALSLPLLRRVGGKFEWIAYQNTLDLPVLEQIGGRLYFAKAFSSRVARFPALRSVGGELYSTATPGPEEYTFDALESVGGRVFLQQSVGFNQQGKAHDVRFPRLETAGGIALYFPRSVELTALKRSAGLGITSSTMTSLALPSFEQTTGFAFTGNRLLRSVTVPRLATSGTLVLRGNPLLEIDVPNAGNMSYLSILEAGATRVRMPNVALVSAYFVLEANPDLRFECGVQQVGKDFAIVQDGAASVSLGRLRTVSGRVMLQNNPALELTSTVESIGAELFVQENGARAVLLPALSTVTGRVSFHANPGLERVDISGLTAAGLTPPATDAILFLDNPKLVSVVLPRSNRLDAALVRFEKNNALASLSASGLVTLTGSLTIRSNAALTTLAFPALTSLGPRLVVSANPLLPLDQAYSVRDRLVANGWTGSASIN